MSLDDNQASLRTVIDAGVLAGAVTLVWRGGELLQVNELGHRDVRAGLPMQRDTVFRIASMTKPVTVATALTLVEEGAFALTDPVAHWLPELADVRVLADPSGPLEATVSVRRPITFLDLMTHRAGFGYAFTVGPPLNRQYGKLRFRQEQDQWLAELAALPLAHQPGEWMTYGHSTDVLGIALSRIDGRTLADVLARRIFEPLGMRDTGFAVTPEARARSATMYQLGSDGQLHDDVMGPPHLTLPPFCTGGAGLWSTADDYLTFARMLLGFGTVDGVRILGEHSVRQMRTDQLTEEQRSRPFLGMPYWHGRGFGLNLAVVTDAARSRQLYGPGGLGAFGWPGAYGTWWLADPSADLIVLYLVQNLPNLSADAGAAVAGNTSVLALQAAQPKFIRTTYRELGLL